MFRIPGRAPYFADASTMARARQSDEQMKSGEPGGGGPLRVFGGMLSEAKKKKTFESDPDNLAHIELFLSDESAIIGILPNGKLRASCASDVDCFVVGSVVHRKPFGQVHDQCGYQSVVHGFFAFLFSKDGAIPAKTHRGRSVSPYFTRRNVTSMGTTTGTGSPSARRAGFMCQSFTASMAISVSSWAGDFTSWTSVIPPSA